MLRRGSSGSSLVVLLESFVPGCVNQLSVRSLTIALFLNLFPELDWDKISKNIP